jgi:cytochrome P450
MLFDIVFDHASVAALLVLFLVGTYALVHGYLNAPKSLRTVPGPLLFALTSWRLAYEDWCGHRIRTIKSLHDRYGPAVRIGPQEISFNSLSALRTIYGAGSGFERTSFYRMFDVYGRPNLFTFASGVEHRERKKLLSHAYSQSVILGSMSSLVEKKAKQYLDLLERERKTASEIFSSLHYFSIDAISEFQYGPHLGGTQAMLGSTRDRALLNDILDPSRRRLSWFTVHFPHYVKWVLSQVGLMERIVDFLGLLPMKKPVVYSGIRAHALKAWYCFKSAPPSVQQQMEDNTVIGKLNKYRVDAELDDLDIASECADHLLAGIDTTADTLLFLVWALSLPKHQDLQAKLREDVSRLRVNPSTGVPSAKDAEQLLYLDAIIKETLRLYAPLPATEPRSCPVDTIIDGYPIPANTVVGMAPYCLHRNSQVFPDPLVFDPTRWLGGPRDTGPDTLRWFWAFSSGGRMCIGMHLAMAEMACLVAALYREYKTKVRDGEETTTPGITSRFECFYDETMPDMKEHECWIDFEKII